MITKTADSIARADPKTSRQYRIVRALLEADHGLGHVAVSAVPAPRSDRGVQRRLMTPQTQRQQASRNGDLVQLGTAPSPEGHYDRNRDTDEVEHSAADHRRQRQPHRSGHERRSLARRSLLRGEASWSSPTSHRPTRQLSASAPSTHPGHDSARRDCGVAR